MDQRFSTPRGSSTYQPEEDAVAIKAPLESDFSQDEGAASERYPDPAFTDRQRGCKKT